MASTKSKPVIASIAALLLVIGCLTVFLFNHSRAARRGANPELLVHTISFKGNSVFTETELAKVIASKVGEPADQAKIDRDVVAIHKLYGQAGCRNISVRAAQETAIGTGQSSLVFVVGESSTR